MHRMQYSVDLSYEVLDSFAEFIFNIEAATTNRQQVIHEQLTLFPALHYTTFQGSPSFNRHIRVTAPRGIFSLRYEATVDIHQHFAEPALIREVPVAHLPTDVLPYLAPSRYCQSDRLLEFANREFGGLKPGYSRITAIAAWVRQHVRFAPRTTNASTSAIDTLVERVGVCRDYAHLMIAICRALSIPARMSSSLDYGSDPMLGPPDFHAFVEVYLADTWYLIDPSGMSIATGLPRIGTGRDAADLPFAAIFGKANSGAPVIHVHPVLDASQGLHLPTITSLAISTC